MRSVLAYTSARLLLFAVAFGVLYLLGARGFLAIVLAFLISGLVSYVLLSKQRDAMSVHVADGLERMRGMGRRLESGASHEDDAQRPGAAPVAPTPLKDLDTEVAAEGDGSAENARQDAEEAPAEQADRPSAGSGVTASTRD
ncbi:DUF4229 domain-containing protein [Nocardiopsis composta]|uniref:DUF4229 domain-containing protein n=1 Tax=Nocardiopsis composta TaxID=157465 RepID=A0A7W8QMM7_9ACTN|nr:DUF4229 domain-containing protein [Nocardiopsis composta]MBB5433130.1 hypothetical protein [Nocardiopsis composta]